MLSVSRTIDTNIRELTNEGIRDLLARNFVCSLAFLSQKNPFVLPITYYFDSDSNSLISHSTEGHKIAAMRNQPEVALCVYEVDTPDKWRSVMVHARYDEVHQIDAKYLLHKYTEGLRELFAQSAKSNILSVEDFSSIVAPGGDPVVFRLDVDTWTGRYRD